MKKMACLIGCFALVSSVVGCASESVTPLPPEKTVDTVDFEKTMRDGTVLVCFYIRNYPEGIWCKVKNSTPNN